VSARLSRERTARSREHAEARDRALDRGSPRGLPALHEHRGFRDAVPHAADEIGGTAAIRVVYRGSVPDLFAPGRDVVLQGRLRDGIFAAVPGSLVTQCPSKYAPKKTKA
jgi:hypothetical protein